MDTTEPSSTSIGPLGKATRTSGLGGGMITGETAGDGTATTVGEVLGFNGIVGGRVAEAISREPDGVGVGKGSGGCKGWIGVFFVDVGFAGAVVTGALT